MKKERLSNREFAKRFDEVAHRFDDISNPYAVYRRHEVIARHLRGKCLEVGAGTGNLMSYISKRGNNKGSYVMSDISQKMCGAAKRKFGCSAVCCDAEKLAFKDRSFDSVVAAELVYYLEHPEDFVKESHRVLKDKGRLVITTANQDMRIYDAARKLLRNIGLGRMYFDDGVKSFIKLGELEKMLKKNNFNIKSSGKIVFLPFMPFHSLNLIFEKTFLSHFCAFTFIVWEKA